MSSACASQVISSQRVNYLSCGSTQGNSRTQAQELETNPQ